MKSVAGILLLAAAALLPVWLSGCAAQDRPGATPLQQRASANRIREIRRIALTGDHGSIPLLVNRLDDDDSAVRFAAIMALEEMTGERFGYAYGASASKRSAAVSRWRTYVERRSDVAAPENGANTDLIATDDRA